MHRTLVAACAMSALFTFSASGANAQQAAAPAATTAPSGSAGDAETRFSDAWYAKFAPPGNFTNASGYPCSTYRGTVICAVGGSVPSHGKNETLKKKAVVKPKR